VYLIRISPIIYFKNIKNSRLDNIRNILNRPGYYIHPKACNGVLIYILKDVVSDLFDKIEAYGSAVAAIGRTATAPATDMNYEYNPSTI